MLRRKQRLLRLEIETLGLPKVMFCIAVLPFHSLGEIWTIFRCLMTLFPIFVRSVYDSLICLCLTFGPKKSEPSARKEG